MGIGLSLATHHFLGCYQLQEQRPGDPYREFEKVALNAFKKFTYQGREMYTCNVDRLHECNRLGDEKQITLWKTHFFLVSRHFDLVSAVVFNRRPGIELAKHSASTGITAIFLALSPDQMVDTENGHIITLNTPLVFVSMKDNEGEKK